jgi:LuxR family maltose regulon positive regulatory protein
VLQTAVLDRLCGPLCDTVVGTVPTMSQPAVDRRPLSPSQAILEYLIQANLFIVPLDDRREWVRYHHLFADLLRRRLTQTQPDLVPVLHRRASDWYAEHGQPAAAIEHATSAGDLDRAADLIDAVAEDALWGQGTHATLQRWLATLPEGQIGRYGRLCVYHAWLLFSAGRHVAAEQRLRLAERASGRAAGDASLQLPGMIAAVRALIAYFQGDVPGVVEHARQALAMLPAESAMWRSSAAISLGDAYRWRGEMVAAGQCYEQAAAASRSTGNQYLVVLVGVKQILIDILHGRLSKAASACQAQLQRLESSGLSHMPVAAGVLAAWASVLYEWNDLDRALQCAQRACVLSEQGSSVGTQGLCYLALNPILYATGDARSVRETVLKLDALAQTAQVPVWIDSGLAMWKVDTLIAQGALDAAARILQARGLLVRPASLTQESAHMDETEAIADLPYGRQAERLSLARLYAAQGQFTAALDALDGLAQQTGAQAAWEIVTLVLRARILYQAKDPGRSQAVLKRALSLAAPEGYVRVFLDEGPLLRELLKRAALRGTAPEYVGRLLAAYTRENQPRSTASPLGSESPSPLIEPLSARELDVLRLLTTYLSSTEIAQELSIAPSTVRSHVKHIYGKLGVHSRGDAVRSARELGLV